MKTPKIAVVTTCENDYQRYCASRPESEQKSLKKVSVLSDIKESAYNKMVLLIDSKNITNHLIQEVTKISLIIYDLSQKTIYV
jgi:hypothetical protein